MVFGVVRAAFYLLWGGGGYLGRRSYWEKVVGAYWQMYTVEIQNGVNITLDASSVSPWSLTRGASEPDG
jgi:hypothetical protein